MRRPPGRREVDGPGEERLAEDDAGDAGVAHAAEAVEVADAAGDEDLGVVRPNERSQPLEVRRRVPPWARTNRRTPAPTSSPTRRRRVGGADRRHGNAASRSGRGSSPTASQSPATARHAAQVVGSSATAVRQARRASRRRRRRAGSAPAPSTPPASWSGDGDARRDRADRLEVGRRARAARRRSRRGGSAARPGPTKCSAMRSGRSVGRPDARRAPGQKTTRERPSSRSIAGMTCTHGRSTSVDARGSLPSPRSSRRWKLIGRRAVAQQRVVEVAQRERVAEPALLVARAARAGATLPSRYDSW